MTVARSAAAWWSCPEAIMTRWIKAWAARKPEPATAAGQRGGRQARAARARPATRKAAPMDEMRIEWPGVRDSGDAGPPGCAGRQHRKPIGDVEYRQDCCEPSLHGHLLPCRRAAEVRRDREPKIPGSAVLAGVWSEFCPWQGGADPLNSRLRTCWLALATSVFAFQKSDAIGDHSFIRDIRMGWLEGKE
jgi:hypothetical protein